MTNTSGSSFPIIRWLSFIDTRTGESTFKISVEHAIKVACANLEQKSSMKFASELQGGLLA